MPTATKSDAPMPDVTAKAPIEINATDHRTLRKFIVVFLDLTIENDATLKMFTSAQTLILNFVKMVLDLMERGGHALRGVTAHGSPGGPLQFARLEAALATTFH